MTAVLVVICGLMVLGGILWFPLHGDGKERGGLGAALLTGGVISLSFWLLQDFNAAHQRELAKRDESHQKQLEERQASEQQRIAQKQTLAITIGLQNDLSGADLSGKDLSGIDLGGKNLTRADLSNADLEHARLAGADLERANLAGANMAHSNLGEANLRLSTLGGADLRHTYLFAADLSGSVRGPRGAPVDLAEVTLIDAKVRGACLAGTNFEGARLLGADFTGSVLTSANFHGAQLEFDGVPINLRHAYVAGTSSGVRARSLTSRDLLRHQLVRLAPASRGTDRVVAVIDGNTIRLQRLGWVRLLGTAAPRLTNSVGQQARTFLMREFSRAPVVHYLLGPQRREPIPPEVGRWLAYVWFGDGRFVNQELLELGYAQRETKHPEYGPYAHALGDTERVAMAAGRGVWTTCTGD
jgi:uncharacterized protein YjbI with pentapeptide repeats